MNLDSILDVIIGLAFAYFLLALIASGLQEIIAGIFQWRGTYLSKGIDVILSSSPSAAFQWAGFWDFLRAHFTWMLPPTPASPASAFPAAGATTDEQAKLALERILAVQRHPLVRGSPTGLPSYVSSRNFGLALLEALRDGSKLPLFSQVERTISQLPEGDLRRTLSLFVQNAGGDLNAFQAHIERWFDDAMDRLSGIYTRISQYMTIILGLILAVSLNVDSVHMARTLWQDPYLRGMVSAAAAKQVELSVQASTATANAPVQPSGGNETKPSPKNDLKVLEGNELPIGWSVGTRPIDRGGYLFGVLGWLFTAAAVGLGAPFWFSLLQQLTNIRSAGPKPATYESGTTLRGSTPSGRFS